MTCVIGLIDRDEMYIGADSAGVCDSWSLRTRVDSKVFRRGEMLFGFTSSFRMGQLLRYTLKIPERKPGQTHFEYMCVDFVDAVRKCLKDGGYAEIDKNREEGGQFIVAYQGRLYRVETDFQVGMHVEPYIACGSGEQYAMGALAATQNIRGMTPTVRIRNALNIAARFCASVRPPHKVIRLLRR